MNEWFPSPLLRFSVFSVLILLCLGLIAPLFVSGPAAQTSGPKIWLRDSQPLPVTYTGAGVSSLGLRPGVGAPPQPLSMTSADIDGDGIADLVVGYDTGFIAVHRGNLDAFAPQSDASFQAIAHSQFPSPFLPQARTFAVPVNPDFIAAGDFTGRGHTDLVIASRGGTTLSIFAGDGKGNFVSGQTINVPGNVTSLGAGILGKTAPFSTLLVGVSGPQQTFLAVYGGGQQGLAPLAAFPVSAPATNISFGDFADVGPDAAFLSGGQVVLLHSSSMKLETLSLPVSASAMAVGWFVYDRNPGLQIALLDSNGSIVIAAHNEFDPHVRTLDEIHAIRQAVISRKPSPLIPRRFVATHGWKIVESIPSAAPFTPGQPPLLFRTRVSNRGADDVMVLNPSMGQMAVVSHSDPVLGASTFVPAQVSTRPYAGSPVAALSARVNVDGRPGVLVLHQGEMAPRVMMPGPDPTFTVNRTDDPTPVSPITNACNGVANDCSLREAILRANGDTVMVPAGTYTLTIAKVTNDCSGNFGALSVENSATIVGAGQNTTIIQAGTLGQSSGTPNGVDMVMNVNEDLGTANCPETNASASISNLTIQNGQNNGDDNVTFDGDGGCMEFDTGSSNSATLTLTNVTLNNCTTTKGNGGGIAIFNVGNGAGGVTISNSIIQNNSAVDSEAVGTGGGIWVAIDGNMTMSNSQVINNLATQVNGTAGSGGGITTTSNVPGSPTVTIHASTISGNQSAGEGGGIKVGTNLLIDQSSVISGNSAGSANLANQTDGGGIYSNIVSPDSATLNKVTITGNSAPHGTGGGIFNGNNSGAGNLTITFSRLAGNSAGTAASKNLQNDNSTVTATNNWWGTNTPSGTINNVNGGTTTFDPFIVLSLGAGSTALNVAASTGLTADFLHDNHSALVGLSNIDVLLGLPIAFTNNTSIGSITGADASIQATGTASAIYTAVGGGTDPVQATVDNGTATVNIAVTSPPSIIKSFTASSVPLSGTTSLNFTINNPNTSTGLTGIAFTDALPSGLQVSNPNGLTGTCGAGTITALAGSGVVSLASGTVAASGSCTFSVNVDGTTAGTKNNTTGKVTSVEGGQGGTASASLKVEAPPVLAKAFTPSGIANVLNATSTLSFTVTNPATNPDPLTGVGFSDTLPAGLVISTPNGLSGSCGGGTITATQATNVISLVGAVLATNSNCTFSVSVTVTPQPVGPTSFPNTTGAVTSTNGGTGNTASAGLFVGFTPPTITKLFGAPSIPLSGTALLTFNINNPNAGQALTVSFNDILPAGLAVANPPALSSTCAGTPTAVAGAGSVSLSGGTVAASGSCTLSVNVTGTTAGAKINSVIVHSVEAGDGNTSSASITVVSPPVIIKAFGAASIPLNGTTSLSFTIQNNNATQALSGIGFSDTLPAGLVISTPNGQTGTCGGGTITATQGTNVISLSGATLAQSSSCTFSVNVTGTAAGLQNNTTGNVTSIEGGTGGTASASIAVVAPPSIAKAFNPTGIPPNGTSTLSITITNPPANTAAENGVAFTDNFPANLVVATPNGLTNSCGGTATATAGSGSVSLTGGTIPINSSCTLSVNVTSSVNATYPNTTGAVTSTNGGTGNTASASLNVAIPPTISKLFLPNTTVQTGTSLLSFTITNPNSSNGTPPPNDLTLTGIQFTDALPAGMVVATPNQLSNDCGGTVTATPGSSSITLSGGTLAPAIGLSRFTAGSRPRQSLLIASGSCFISVKVQATTIGTKNNTTGPISANESGPGASSNTASLTVTSPPAAPTLAKAFGAATIPANVPTTLTFTMTNPNSGVAMTNISFTDTLPSGLVVASPNGLPNGCADPSAAVTGEVIANPGSNTISMTALTLNGSASCSFSINVTGTSPGTKNNTTSNVTAAFDDGTGTFVPITGGAGTASITVLVPDLTIAKAHGTTFKQGDVGDTYTITVSNTGNAPTVGTVTATDAFPATLIATAISGAGWTCNPATLSCTRSDALAFGNSYPPITITVNVPINAPASVTNTATVSGGGEINTSNDTANDLTAITPLPGPPLTITPSGPNTATVTAGSSASFAFTVNSASSLLGPIDFTCTGLPPGATCAFDKQGETQSSTQVTMTMTTVGQAAAASPFGLGRTGPMYAALLFPLFGLVHMASGRRKGKKSGMRLIMLVGSLLVLLALAGCGGRPRIGTPKGAFSISVTATSTSAPIVTANTQVTLNIQ